MSGAVVYLRISQDRTGQQAGIQRQQEDCLALAARLGITDPLVFIDNDVSTFDGGRRPGYDAMATHLRGGAFRIIGERDRVVADREAADQAEYRSCSAGGGHGPLGEDGLDDPAAATHRERSERDPTALREERRPHCRLVGLVGLVGGKAERRR